jgi:hypothetical protein
MMEPSRAPGQSCGAVPKLARMSERGRRLTLLVTEKEVRPPPKDGESAPIEYELILALAHYMDKSRRDLPLVRKGFLRYAKKHGCLRERWEDTIAALDEHFRDSLDAWVHYVQMRCEHVRTGSL